MFILSWISSFVILSVLLYTCSFIQVCFIFPLLCRCLRNHEANRFQFRYTFDLDVVVDCQILDCFVGRHQIFRLFLCQLSYILPWIFFIDFYSPVSTFKFSIAWHSLLRDIQSYAFFSYMTSMAITLLTLLLFSLHIYLLQLWVLWIFPDNYHIFSIPFLEYRCHTYL